FDYSAYRTQATNLLLPAANFVLGLEDGKKRWADVSAGDYQGLLTVRYAGLSHRITRRNRLFPGDQERARQSHRNRQETVGRKQTRRAQADHRQRSGGRRCRGYLPARRLG